MMAESVTGHIIIESTAREVIQFLKSVLGMDFEFPLPSVQAAVHCIVFNIIG